MTPELEQMCKDFGTKVGQVIASAVCDLRAERDMWKGRAKVAEAEVAKLEADLAEAWAITSCSICQARFDEPPTRGAPASTVSEPSPSEPSAD